MKNDSYWGRKIVYRKYNRSISYSILFLISLLISEGKQNDRIQSDKYFGYEKPGSTPEKFAPDFISTQYAEFAGTFSPDYKEYYFTRRGPFPNGLAQIMVTKNIAGTWSEPVVADFSSNNYEFEPFITPDGMRLYFGSRRSPDGVSPAGAMHQWYLEKLDSTWSEPILLGSPFFERMVMYPTVSNSGTIYFTGIDGIYFSELVNGAYQEPVKMGTEINFLPFTAHSFIASDESYLIFDGQPRGEGKTDIYVSYKKQDGNWTKGKLLSKEINSGESQAIASVSPDGECLFFTRNSDIYWVDAAIIDEIKLIPTFTIFPDSGIAPLNIKITTNLSTVPDSIISFRWDFNNNGGVDSFEANPEYTFTEPGLYSIKLNVFTESDSASKTFYNIIKVLDIDTGLNEDNSHPEFQLHQNFPNPFNPNTIIKFGLPHSEHVVLKIYDILGNEVAALLNKEVVAGVHEVEFGNSYLSSGFYFYRIMAGNFISTKKMLLVK